MDGRFNAGQGNDRFLGHMSVAGDRPVDMTGMGRVSISSSSPGILAIDHRPGMFGMGQVDKPANPAEFQ